VNPPLIELDLSIRYGARRVIEGVHLCIDEGEILGLVGPSGSGKSTIALALLGLLPYKGGVAEGRIAWRGAAIEQFREGDWRRLRGRDIGLVMQSPVAALNPERRIGSQIEEAWRVHSPVRGWTEHEAITQTLAEVSLPADPAFRRLYPRELSVGMAQRLLIAMAILHRPALLLADEPTSALDPITQVAILKLFARLSKDRRMAMLYISHDLASVASLCDRVAVLHDGRIVECALPGELFREPKHKYTSQLVEAATLPLGVVRPVEGPLVGSAMDVEDAGLSLVDAR
jgi:ABC-type glutathione transport system ATPase component